LCAVREKRQRHLHGNAPLVEDYSRPGNLQASILNKYFWQRLVLATVPGLFRWAQGQKRRHPLGANHPHLAGVLFALFYSTQRVHTVLGKELLPRSPNGLRLTE